MPYGSLWFGWLSFLPLSTIGTSSGLDGENVVSYFGLYARGYFLSKRMVGFHMSDA
jgi:hypothetical protein